VGHATTAVSPTNREILRVSGDTGESSFFRTLLEEKGAFLFSYGGKMYVAHEGMRK
jgi:hypothetical protein